MDFPVDSVDAAAERESSLFDIKNAFHGGSVNPIIGKGPECNFAA